MNTFNFTPRSRALCAALGLMVALPQGLFAAAPMTLANTPLLTTSSGVVKPNIMFSLDDSGSMNDEEVPDWAGDYGTTEQKHSAEFNAIYYNPATYYEPPPKTFSASNIPTPYDSQTGADSTTKGADTGTKPNWRAVRFNGFDTSSSTKTNLESPSPYFHTLIAGEFCNSPKMTTCQTGSSGSFTYPAVVRWCTDSALTNCQALFNSGNSFTKQRVPGMGTWTSTASVTAGSSSSARTVTGIKVLNKQIMAGTASATGDNNLATAIRAQINLCTSAISGNCQIIGFSASGSGNSVKITSPHGGPLTLTVDPTSTASSFSPPAFSGTGTVTPGYRIRTDIVKNVTSYAYPTVPVSAAAHSDRTDCTAGSPCTYNQEMTNYANWYTYYRKRVQTMKSGVSFAFQGLDNSFRVGFTTINQKSAGASTTFQDIDEFTVANKNDWYSKLQGATTGNSTPLRGALMKMGRYYANKASGQTKDPVQYSCQQNFAILSTDGYWNDGDETTSYGPFKVGTNTSVGNQDSDSSAASKAAGYWEGSQSSSDTLADVSMYYYSTDLRTNGLGNCDYKVNGTFVRKVCDNNVFVGTKDRAKYQHMATFTMGLGIDGNLQYESDYTNYPPGPAAADAGDFELMVKNGTPMWGKPSTSGKEANIDDLWHAAVNGRGYYFSAKDPGAIAAGFKKVLDDISSRSASGSGAALGSQTPTPGTDYAYMGSYTSVLWTGNVQAHAFKSDGTIATTPTWCVEDVPAETCDPPDVQGVNGSGQTTCTTLGPFGSCPAGSTLVGSDCVRIIPSACQGSLKNRITSPSSDDRRILMANPLGGGNKLIDFNYTNLSTVNFAAIKPYFEEPWLTSQGLSQYAGFNSAQRTAASGANLVNYLRGHTLNDMRDSNVNKYFRKREAVLGDVTESRVFYVGQPVMKYTDPGYTAFQSTSRTSAVYAGANDGMLHAFQASGGSAGRELWAFIPTAVMSKMWTLADNNYAKKHVNMVNGKSFQGDVFDGTNWRTIVVAGMGNGGKGYFALDITDPTDPKLLWELSDTSPGMANLGYAYGQPTVTKVSDGAGGLKWAALLPSGYNNTGTGNGGGYLYVRDALTGAAIRTIATGTGTVGSPSGLSEVTAWADDRIVNAESHVAYGGDLDGNVWRFDLDSASNAGLLAKLDIGGVGQPVTTRPELGLIEGNKVVFVGTGKYLETTDLSTTGTQSFYGIADKGAGSPTVTRSNLVGQTLTSAAPYRTSTNNAVDWTQATTLGWRVDFPDVGERVTVSPTLVGGVLLVPTTVPTASDCSPGGYSWFNYFDYETGGNVAGTTYTGVVVDGVITGVSVYTVDGDVHIMVTTSNSEMIPPDTPSPDNTILKKMGGKTGAFQQTRVMWRELIQ